MTPTRRDAMKLTAGGALAAVGMKPLTTAASTPPEPFDVDKYCPAWTLMTAAGGVHAATDPDAFEAMLDLYWDGTPLPAEHEWARQQCREVMLALLARLEGDNTSEAT